MEEAEKQKKIDWLTAEVEKLTALFSQNASVGAGAGSSLLGPNAAVQSTASYHVPSPRPIQMQGDVAANIKFFKSTWQNYVAASGLDKRPA